MVFISHWDQLSRQSLHPTSPSHPPQPSRVTIRVQTGSDLEYRSFMGLDGIDMSSWVDRCPLWKQKISSSTNRTIWFPKKKKNHPLTSHIVLQPCLTHIHKNLITEAVSASKAVERRPSLVIKILNTILYWSFDIQDWWSMDFRLKHHILSQTSNLVWQPGTNLALDHQRKKWDRQSWWPGRREREFGGMRVSVRIAWGSSGHVPDERSRLGLQERRPWLLLVPRPRGEKSDPQLESTVELAGVAWLVVWKIG